jgi:radical SAM protein with 4Fe4S-binding SPASM domain
MALLKMAGQAPHIIRTLSWNPAEVTRRAGAILSYYLPVNPVCQPRKVDLYVTYRCNLRCKMCWLWGESGTQPRTEEMSLADIEVLIDRIKAFRPLIAFSGGEPLTRPDIIEILDYARRQSLRTELLTNGTLITPEHARGLAGRVDRVLISIDGPRETNDLIRGRGSFDRTVRGIELLQAAVRKGREKTGIRINCVISSLNYPHLDELVDIAHALGCHLSFQHLIFSSDEVVRRHDGDLRARLDIAGDTARGCVSHLHELDVDVLTEKLKESREKAERLKVPFIVSPFLDSDDNVREWYAGLAPLPGLRCTFPWVHLYIRPNGDVTPCEFIEYRLGNILRDDVKSIFNGRRAQDFRKNLKKRLFPACHRCCKLLPSPLV